MFKTSNVFAKKVFTLGSAAAILGSVGLAACSDSNSPGGDAYTLRTVDGDTLPLIDSVAREGGYSVFKVSSGTVRLDESNRFTFAIAVDTGSTATNLHRNNAFNGRGSYSKADTVITFDLEGAEDDLVGSIRNDTLKFSDVLGEADLVFVKR